MHSDGRAKAEGMAILALMAAVALAIELWPAGTVIDPGHTPVADIELRAGVPVAVTPRDAAAILPATREPVHEIHASLAAPATSETPTEPAGTRASANSRDALVGAPLTLRPIAFRNVLPDIPVALDFPDASIASATGNDKHVARNAVTRGFRATGGALRTAVRKTSAGLSVLGKAF